MPRMMGTLLIALSVICVAATLLWVGREIPYLPRDPNENQRTLVVAGLLFAGIFLASTVFVAGRCLRCRYADKPDTDARGDSDQRPLPLIIYLGGSLALGLLAALCMMRVIYIGPLSLFVCQPYILGQLLLAFMGVEITVGTGSHMLILGSNLMYFPAFFYPLYRMLTMDRTLELGRYRRMRNLMAVLTGVHLLVAMFVAMAASRA